MGRTMCTVVVAGATMRSFAVRRTVAASLQATVAVSLGSAWFSPSNDIFSEKNISSFKKKSLVRGHIKSITIGIADFFQKKLCR